MSTYACSSTFICTMLISVFPWFSMKVTVTWWFVVPAWVTLKLPRGVFSYHFSIKTSIVQSVCSEHQWMFINFHLFSVDQWFFLIFHESSSYLMIFCASITDIKIMKGMFSYNFGMENSMVQSIINQHQWMSINFQLFSVDLCVSLIFHESYSY